MMRLEMIPRCPDCGETHANESPAKVTHSSRVATPTLISPAPA